MLIPIKAKLIIALLLCTFGSYSQTWQDVGGGTNNSSHGMVVWNDQLINLGSFSNPCDKVASWDGVSWSCLGGGVGIVARAATVWDGKLVVVGDFWNVQQPCVGCNGVAVWDGVSWSPLGNGVNNDVLSVTVWNNQVVIAGDFTQADGVPVTRVIRFDGATWQSIGTIGDFDNDIRGMTEFEGELWVGGDFNNVGGNSSFDGLVKWDVGMGSWQGGNSGVDLIGGVNETVRVLYVNPNDGNLYMGGHFPELWDGDAPAQDFDMSGVAMYDGSNWTPLGTGLNDYVRAMHEYNGDIVCGGIFTDAGGTPANKIARFNSGTGSWSAMGLGFDLIGPDEYVKSAAVWDGIFFAGGAYSQAEGNPMDYIAQWYEAPTNPPVAWMTTSATTICAGECIDFLDNSTNAPTSWNWAFPGSDTPTSSAQNPGTVCYLSQGTFTASLQACNAFGCNTQDITINVTSAPSLTVNDASICDGGSATLTAVPSVGGGSYLWSPGSETTASITVSPGTTTMYSVQYFLPGCNSNVAISTVTVGTTPTVSASNETICEGNSATLVATPSVGGGTYLWSLGSEVTSSITNSPATTTSYSVVYTLNGCPSTSETGTITVDPTPTITVNDASICDGGSGTLTATPSLGGGTYLWSPGSEVTQSITNSPASTTSYSVVYTLNGCASTSETGTITVGVTPTVSVNSETICDGASTTIIAIPSAGGGTYLWSPGSEITSSINVSPSTTTVYSVVYTLNGCPSTSESSTITVTPTPVITVNDESICDGNSATLPATPDLAGGSYLWSPGSEVTQSITNSPVTTTSYSVIYTLNGCPSSSVTGTITVSPTPSLSVNNESICDGASATLTATPSIGGGTYLWSPGSEVTQSITYSPATTTSYSVVYTLNGCPSTSESGTITVTAIPTVSVNNETICDGSSATLIATPSVGGGSYLWSPGSEVTSSINVSPASTTSYSVVYTLNGCASTSSTGTVTVNSTPTISVDNVTVCEGSSGTLTATPGTSGGTYLWSPGSEITPSITYSPASTTSYSVVYTLNGCPSQSESGTITVNPVPTVSSNDLSLCDGTEGTLIATPSITGGTYLWSPGSEVTASILVNPAASTSYTVVYTLDGCSSPISTSVVTILPMPDVFVTELSNVLTANQASANYQWLDCNDNNAIVLGETNQSFSPTLNGSYSVEVDLGGCLDTSICITLSTIGIDELSVYAVYVYPNPVGEQLQIQSEYSVDGVGYDIVDAQGRIVLTGKLTSSSLIQTGMLMKGEYLLRLGAPHHLLINFVKL